MTYNYDDVRHDLAMMMLDVQEHPDWEETFGDVIAEYTQVLETAGELLPTNIREVTFVERMYCDDCGRTFPHAVTLSANTRMTECLRCFLGVVSTIHIPNHSGAPAGEPLDEVDLSARSGAKECDE